MEQIEDIKRRLLDGNTMFSKAVDPSVLSRLAEKQEPFVAILACSDSRVDPAKAFNLSMGSAFVVRTAGNCAADQTVLGSLEYAVGHLGVKVVVVMGHTNCGAIRASFECHDIENLERVMADIETAKASLEGLRNKDHTMIAESKVRVQIRRLLDCSEVIREAVRKGKVEIIGAMFDISVGSVRFI